MMSMRVGIAISAVLMLALLMLIAYRYGAASRDTEVRLLDMRATVAEQAIDGYAQAQAQARLESVRADELAKRLAKRRASRLAPVLTAPRSGTDADQTLDLLRDYHAAVRRLRDAPEGGDADAPLP